MTLKIPAEYAGLTIPASTIRILPILEQHGFSLILRGKAKRSIRIVRAGKDYGYINPDVIKNRGIFGYHFRLHGRNADACPEHLRSRFVTYFCEQYGIDAKAVKILEGTSANSGKKCLIVTDAQVAIKVLLVDAEGFEATKDLAIIQKDNKFVEARIPQVVSNRRERNAAARAACLNEHGFDCYACGVNLRKVYKRLAQEFIHVHHEEPLSESEGEYEFDPVEKMKPVCPNCHAVIHSKVPPYSIDEVRSML
jgi:predicted HNH restriction endonuclease